MTPNDSLSVALAELEALLAIWTAAFRSCSRPSVEAARIEFLGQKQGRLKAAQERLKTLEPSSRSRVRPAIQRDQAALEAALGAAKSRTEQRDVASRSSMSPCRAS